MALLLFFLTFLAFFLLGDKVCKTWGLRFSEPGEALVFCTALGLVAVSYLTAVLAFTGWITPLSAWILLALIYVSRARKSIEVLRHLGRWLRPSSFLGRVRRLGRFDQFSLASSSSWSFSP